MNLPNSGAARVLLGALCALCVSAPAYAAVTVESDDGEAGFELVGHTRSFSLFVEDELNGVQSLVSQRVRPALEVWTPWGLSLEVAYDIVPVTGGAGSLAAGLAALTALASLERSEWPRHAAQGRNAPAWPTTCQHVVVSLR